MSSLDDLEKIQKLKEKGILSEEEFEAEKKKILNMDNNSVKNNICKKCGAELEDRAIFCGKCGSKVQKTFIENLKTNKKWLIIILVIIIVVIGIVYNSEMNIKSDYNSSNNENSTTKDSEEKKDIVSNSTIIACARTEVSKLLRSSSTANWGTAEIIDEDSYGRYLVYVPLEAQNGFGGYEKLYYLVIVSDVTPDGYYKAMPYQSTLDIPNYTGQTIPNTITEYKNGERTKLISEFLENNKWEKPVSTSTNTTTTNSTNTQNNV